GEISAWVTKAEQQWPQFRSGFLRSLYWRLFQSTDPSCHVMNLPALGAGAGVIMGSNWLLSALTCGRRASRYVVCLSLFFIALVTMMGLMHLATEFADHRDVGLIVGMLVASLGFVFMMPRLGPGVRTAVFAYAVGLSVYNYVDVGSLQGKHYGDANYAVRSQETAETLRMLVRDDARSRHLHGPVYLVVDELFPLQYLYLHDTSWGGLTPMFISDQRFCSTPVAEVDAALAAGCEPVMFAVHRAMCRG